MEQYDDIPLIEAPQRRNIGFWAKLGGGPLTFAILIHVIILLLGAIWIFQVIPMVEKKVDFMPGGGGGGGERGAETKVESKKRQQLTPQTNVKRVFAEGATSTYSIPDPGDNFGEMQSLNSLTGGGMSGGLGGSGTGKGFGSGSGSGMGSGKGFGKLFGLIPETMRKRCSPEDRLKRLNENGGNKACEDAVVKALRWLKANQSADGSWGTSNKTAMTGLALLAYFGHCETPVSEEFGDTTYNGITYLVNFGMKHDGRMAENVATQPFCYEHAIATYALAEAYTFCKELKVDIPNLAEITEKAGQFIIENQNQNGGWAYQYVRSAGHTDVSIVGWQVQALKACDHTGLKFPRIKSCISDAHKYLSTCQNENGAFGYTNKPPMNNAHFPLTGVGMLCFQMWGKGEDRMIRKAAKYTLETTTFDFKKDADLYAHYYESQAMMHAGGQDWKKYNQMYRDELLKNQQSDGSWKVPPGSAHVKSEHMATCLCTLMLEVYYRFLNTSGGGGSKGMRESRPI